MEKDCQKRRQPSSTDSVIARLMGLDELSPQRPHHKQRRVLSDSYIRKTASIGLQQESLVYIGRSRDTNNEMLHGVKGLSGVQIYKDENDFVLDKYAHSSINMVKMVIRSQKPAVASVSKSTSGAIYEDRKAFGKKGEHRATGYVLRYLQKLENDSFAGHLHDLGIDYTNNILEFKSGMIDKPSLSSTGFSVFKPKSEKVTNYVGDIKLDLLSRSEHRQHRSLRPESGKLHYDLTYKELFKNDIAFNRIMNRNSRQERCGSMCCMSKDLLTPGNNGDNYLANEPEAMVSSFSGVYDYKDYNHVPHPFLNQSSLAKEAKKKNFDRCKAAKEIPKVEVSGRDQTHGEMLALADMESMPKYLNLRLGRNGLGTLSSMQCTNSGSISPSSISRIKVWENDHIRSSLVSEFEAIKETLLHVCNSKKDETTRRDSKSNKEERSPQEILEPRCGSDCEQFSSLEAFNRVVTSRLSGDQQSELNWGILSVKDGYSSYVWEVFSGEASSNELYDEESGYSNSSRIGPPEFQKDLKGINQCSPDSALEPFDIQNPSTFECFGSIGQQLQLQVLNSESEVTYSEGSEMVVSGDQDLEEVFVDLSHDDKKVHRWLGEDESRSFSYLVDVLDEAGFCGEKSIMDFKTWHSLECPISPLVFEALEKKYDRQTSWQKSERQLLFDRINSGLMGIVNPLINFHVRPTSITRRFIATLKRDKVEDELWMMLISQEKEKSRDMSEKALEGAMKWLEFDEDINIICRELETSTFDELVIESISL